MPDVRPFRGVRYDMAQVGTLSDVVAPPYDVIDPALQDRLYQASPYNIIRLELNREEPGDAETQNRYTRAARFLKDWLRRGHSPRGRPPGALRLPADLRRRGQTHTRKGFLARVRLEPFGQGKIYPARADALRPEGRPPGPLSTRPGSTSARSSGSIPTPTPRCCARSRRACATARRWRRPITSASRTGSGSSTDQETHTARPGPDGRQADLHRRRPPPLRDRPEVPRRPGRSRRSPRGPDDPANFCLMMLVGMSDPGLLDPADAPAGLGLPRPDRRRR